MLEDVADTITFSTTSPDTCTSVTCAQCEPALIREENGKPVVDLLILVFSGKCQSCCMILDCEHRSLIPSSWSLFMTVWSVTCTPVACWRSFCRTLAVLLLFLLTHGADISPAAGLLSIYGPVHLSSCNGPSPSISSMFLRLCWETHQTSLLQYHPGGAGLSV